MSIDDDFEVPNSAQDLPLATEPDAKFFILYIASTDPATQQPWCSDVRAALPILNQIFSAPSSPEVHYAYVGSKVEFKENPSNRFRTDWNINNIPALVRYQWVGGKVEEVGRLKEDELLDEKRVQDLIAS
ncbi:hypothetical protein CC86DRAFT_371615 [Ophiobolus disseminans]|uniref:Thioredoxin domain-containing protein n=1 Tax=Ophiobolus disseminans TaxID=1469910 RepID=A0A6A6ZUU8_9PLEO|nr:hypothetical protein CC86DRAFT_371615 [Ophiobolus disseminans]